MADLENMRLSQSVRAPSNVLEDINVMGRLGAAYERVSEYQKREVLVEKEVEEEEKTFDFGNDHFA